MDEHFRKVLTELRLLGSSAAADALIEHYPQGRASN
jgi:hypothetical protein